MVLALFSHAAALAALSEEAKAAHRAMISKGCLTGLAAG
jgi:hypothetical protein